jgi:hypothetical protein
MVESGLLRIAILGAGNAGTCAALELASRGLKVDLYDECSQPVSRASFHNEGKVHLGILYAKDPSLRTARLMITGALSFEPLLRRWAGFDAGREGVSTPFFYGVHKGTMVDVDTLRAHYASCERLFEHALAAGAEPYLGIDRRMVTEEVPTSEFGCVVNPDYFVAMFRTSERAVDPRRVALLLRAAILANPRIHFVGSSRVTDVSWLGRGGLLVTFTKDCCTYTERYDQVANTLWHGRLEIDDRIGLRPDHPWSHRYKFANRVFIPLSKTAVPSITCVLGPFGDIVNYGDGGLFLSWYPDGMIDTSYDLRPPDWDAQLTYEQRHRVFRSSLAEWIKRCPLLQTLTFTESDVDPGGGVIFAWGDTDVDDPQSKLHDRYDVGVYSVKCYHSVNTGKYTLAPYMGLKAAERILAAA